MSAPQEIHMQGVVEERAQRLELKREEYDRKWREVLSVSSNLAEAFVRGTTPFWYSFSILNTLVRGMSVNSETLIEKMRQETILISGFNSFNEDMFWTAWNTIQQYVENGEANGRQLPPLPKRS